MNNILEFFNLNTTAADPKEIHLEMESNIRYGIDNVLILASAIMIASIGLNTNSTAVIIGAMLISPIMSPLLTLSYAISISNKKLLHGAMKMIIVYFFVAIIFSTIFFNLSFITTPTSEIISRTSPTIFDFLIALFGGVAGIIGVTRKQKTNVIPGVAIATALMPPLCTIGFGLANGNLLYAYNALILFLTNAYLIVLTSIGILKLMKISRPKNTATEREKEIRKLTFVGFAIILVPIIFNTATTIQRTTLYSDFTIYIDENINTEDEFIISSTNIDYTTKTITIDAIEELSDKDKMLLTQYTNTHSALKDFNIMITYKNVETL